MISQIQDGAQSLLVTLSSEILSSECCYFRSSVKVSGQAWPSNQGNGKKQVYSVFPVFNRFFCFDLKFIIRVYKQKVVWLKIGTKQRRVSKVN